MLIHFGRASHARRDAYCDAPGPADTSYCPPCKAPHPNRQPLVRRRAFGRCWGACDWALLAERSDRRPQSNWIEESPPGASLDREGGAVLDMPASTARDPSSAAETPFRHPRTRHPLTRSFSAHDRDVFPPGQGDTHHSSSTHASEQLGTHSTLQGLRSIDLIHGGDDDGHPRDPQAARGGGRRVEPRPRRARPPHPAPGHPSEYCGGGGGWADAARQSRVLCRGWEGLGTEVEVVYWVWTGD